jgi:hypothetical protein
MPIKVIIPEQKTFFSHPNAERNLELSKNEVSLDEILFVAEVVGFYQHQGASFWILDPKNVICLPAIDNDYFDIASIRRLRLSKSDNNCLSLCVYYVAKDGKLTAILKIKVDSIEIVNKYPLIREQRLLLLLCQVIAFSLSTAISLYLLSHIYDNRM